MARNSKVSLVLVGIVFLFTIFAGVANAGVAPSMFATKEGCESAVLAGEGAYKFYVPKYFGGSKKNPVDNVTSVAAPLEGVACVEMDTTAGRKFVPQAEETEFRFSVSEDSSLKDTPYARHDCGNKVYSISYPTPTIPEKKVEAKAQAPRSGYQIGDPCMAVTPDGKPAQGAITQVFANGGASCDAVVEIEVPGIGTTIAKYGTCMAAGGIVGGYKNDVPGAITGIVSAGLGTYAGSKLFGEKWGWLSGCVTGPVGGLVKWEGGNSLIRGGAVNPPLSGGAMNPPL